MVVEQKQVSVETVWENEQKENLKKQKLAQERAKLEQKTDEMNSLKRK